MGSLSAWHFSYVLIANMNGSGSMPNVDDDDSDATQTIVTTNARRRVPHISAMILDINLRAPARPHSFTLEFQRMYIHTYTCLPA